MVTSKSRKKSVFSNLIRFTNENFNCDFNVFKIYFFIKLRTKAGFHTHILPLSLGSFVFFQTSQHQIFIKSRDRAGFHTHILPLSSVPGKL